MASNRTVWLHQTSTGFNHQIYIMYHSTKTVAAAESICKEGFRNSSAGMLGTGVYVSKDFAKAANGFYGDITFRLLVYVGKVCKIDRQGHPLQYTWQNEYGSAYVPYKCGMVPSGREENCIKSTNQIHILGICKGYDKLQQQGLTRDLTGRTDHYLHRDEKQALDQFVAKLNLKH